MKVDVSDKLVRLVCIVAAAISSDKGITTTAIEYRASRFEEYIGEKQ